MSKGNKPRANDPLAAELAARIKTHKQRPKTAPPDISKIPPSMAGATGAGGVSANRRPKWQVWLAAGPEAEVKLWQFVALSLNVDPRRMWRFEAFEDRLLAATLSAGVPGGLTAADGGDYSDEPGMMPVYLKDAVAWAVSLNPPWEKMPRKLLATAGLAPAKEKRGRKIPHVSRKEPYLTVKSVLVETPRKLSLGWLEFVRAQPEFKYDEDDREVVFTSFDKEQIRIKWKSFSNNYGRIVQALQSR